MCLAIQERLNRYMYIEVVRRGSLGFADTENKFLPVNIIHSFIVENVHFIDILNWFVYTSEERNGPNGFLFPNSFYVRHCGAAWVTAFR